MGDVVSLVEKAALQVSDAEAAQMQDKMANAQFDFDDFMTHSRMVSQMGSMAGVSKMLPGMGNMLDDSQLRQVEARIKRSEAMICNMNNKERVNQELLLSNWSALSRLMRITKGSGLKFEDGVAFMSEFQKMRTLILRMAKQAGVGQGQEGEEPKMELAMARNSNARRAAKKKGKKGGWQGGGMGFA
jgi:signal recognition particle subunit SRP54